MNILSVNIFQTLCFMFNCKTGVISSAFSDINRPKPTKKYPLRSIGTPIAPRKVF